MFNRKKISNAEVESENDGNSSYYPEIASRAFVYTFYSGIVALIILLLYSIGAGGFNTDGCGFNLKCFLEILGETFGIALASAAAGAFIGFLFGIPHTLSNANNNSIITHAATPSAQSSAAPQSANPDSAGTPVPQQTTNPVPANQNVANAGALNLNLRPSTNLEQIADWLTKIIVGVGLVEFKKIIIYFNLLCVTLGESLQNYSGASKNEASIAGAIIIMFTISGFLIAYLWAYLYLIRIQESLEVDQRINFKLFKNDTRNRIATDLATKQLTYGYNEISASELTRAFRVASSTTISNIFYKAVKAWENCWRLPNQKYKIGRAQPVFEALINLDINNKFPENYLQLGYVLKDKEHPEYEKALANINLGIKNIDPEKDINMAFAYYSRAYCLIAVDKQYDISKKEGEHNASTEENKKMIMDDLNKAAADEVVRDLIRESEIIKSWKKINDLPAEN